VAPFTRFGPPSPMNDVPFTITITSDTYSRIHQHPRHWLHDWLHSRSHELEMPLGITGCCLSMTHRSRLGMPTAEGWCARVHARRADCRIGSLKTAPTSRRSLSAMTSGTDEWRIQRTAFPRKRRRWPSRYGTPPVCPAAMRL